MIYLIQDNDFDVVSFNSLNECFDEFGDDLFDCTIIDTSTGTQYSYDDQGNLVHEAQITHKH